MGCGVTKEYNFSICIIKLVQTEEPNQYVLKQTYKEIFTMYEKTSIVQYMFQSTHEEFQSLFKDHKILRKCLFYLVFHGDKTNSVQYPHAYGFIPKDEIYQKTPVMLNKVFVIRSDSFTEVMTFEDLAEQISGCLDIREKVIIPKHQQSVFNKSLSSHKFSLISKKLIKSNNIVKEDERENIICSSSDDSRNLEESDEQLPYEEYDFINEISDQKLNILESKINNKEPVHAINIKFNNFKDLNNLKRLVTILLKDQLYSIRGFYFSDNYVNFSDFDEGWTLILDYILKSLKLRHLDLSMNYIYDKTIEKLAVNLKKKKIISLNLQSNFITKKGAFALANWLRKNKSLRVLNIQQNNTNEFKAEGVESICNAIKKHRCIKSINFSYMNITGVGKCISELLDCSKTLKKLSIRDTRVNLDDLSLILHASNKLEELDISENYQGNNQAIDLISKLILSNTSLMIFNFDSFGINEDNYKSILTALISNKNLVNVSMEDNSVDYSFYLEYFLNLDESNEQKLRKINLSELSVRRKGIKIGNKDKELLDKYKHKKFSLEILI